MLMSDHIYKVLSLCIYIQICDNFVDVGVSMNEFRECGLI